MTDKKYTIKKLTIGVLSVGLALTGLTGTTNPEIKAENKVEAKTEMKDLSVDVKEVAGKVLVTVKAEKDVKNANVIVTVDGKTEVVKLGDLLAGEMKNVEVALDNVVKGLPKTIVEVPTKLVDKQEVVEAVLSGKNVKVEVNYQVEVLDLEPTVTPEVKPEAVTPETVKPEVSKPTVKPETKPEVFGEHNLNELMDKPMADVEAEANKQAMEEDNGVSEETNLDTLVDKPTSDVENDFHKQPKPEEKPKEEKFGDFDLDKLMDEDSDKLAELANKQAMEDEEDVPAQPEATPENTPKPNTETPEATPEDQPSNVGDDNTSTPSTPEGEGVANLANEPVYGDPDYKWQPVYENLDPNQPFELYAKYDLVKFNKAVEKEVMEVKKRQDEKDKQTGKYEGGGFEGGFPVTSGKYTEAQYKSYAFRVYEVTRQVGHMIVRGKGHVRPAGTQEGIHGENMAIYGIGRFASNDFRGKEEALAKLFVRMWESSTKGHKEAMLVGTIFATAFDYNPYTGNLIATMQM